MFDTYCIFGNNNLIEVINSNTLGISHYKKLNGEIKDIAINGELCLVSYKNKTILSCFSLHDIIKEYRTFSIHAIPSSIGFNNSKNVFFIVLEDRQILFYNFNTGSKLASFQLDNSHPGKIKKVCFTENDQYVVVFTSNCAIMVSSNELINKKKAQSASKSCLSFETNTFSSSYNIVTYRPLSNIIDVLTYSISTTTYLILLLDDFWIEIYDPSCEEIVCKIKYTQECRKIVLTSSNNIVLLHTQNQRSLFSFINYSLSTIIDQVNLCKEENSSCLILNSLVFHSLNSPFVKGTESLVGFSNKLDFIFAFSQNHVYVFENFVLKNTIPHSLSNASQIVSETFIVFTPLAKVNTKMRNKIGSYTPIFKLLSPEFVLNMKNENFTDTVLVDKHYLIDNTLTSLENSDWINGISKNLVYFKYSSEQIDERITISESKINNLYEILDELLLEITSQANTNLES